MKVKDLRLMYERCVREIDDFEEGGEDEDIELLLTIDYPPGLTTREGLLSGKTIALDDFDISIGDDICYEFDDEDKSHEAYLIGRIRNSNTFSETVAQADADHYMHGLSGKNAFEYDFLPKIASCDSEQADLDRFLNSFKMFKKKLKEITKKEALEKVYNKKPTAQRIIGNDKYLFTVWMFDDFAVISRKVMSWELFSDMCVGNSSDNIKIHETYVTLPIPSK